MTLDSGSRVSKHCVALIFHALTGNMSSSEQCIAYCRRHIRDISNDDLICVEHLIRRKGDRRPDEVAANGLLDFLDFIEDEWSRRNGG